MIRLFRRIDPFLLIPSLGLSGISFFVLASTGTSEYLHQAVFFALGLAAYLLFLSIDYRLWSRFSIIIYGLTLMFLVILFMLPEIRGAHRWVDFGLFILQPSEILKPLLMLVFAHVISRRDLGRTGNLFFLTAIFIPVAMLIFLQPDLGNTIVYGIFFFAMLIAGGLNLRYISLSLLTFTVFLPGLWLILKDYQKQRILSFLNPNIDPGGAGYNAIQSMIAVGSGGFWGLGLGRGTQSKLFFLPEYQTDFIFATIVESLGFIGGIILIILYLLLLIRILNICFSAEDTMGKVLSAGIFSQIFIQVFINMGMNLGILPITGITLPLVSAGGSSIISTFIALGILNSVAKRKKEIELVIH
ncbi:MAG: rod shape-determining protein RodA, rod shape determining protein RodA [Candidatus Gottesmanbacteria bacterium GW2011_GWA2_43_14]|uniref:Rod shape-determining protein RodA, rod shape determining protein RodA n=1 Tax=Candidatus Gottesmanbacteria bacterium GW2011_GWA2_43_14 TaxID=1618443 RepID=A0A0G1DL23_9BACT|nr:MAG: rod shape-determining protein RodA, rod shape determining protein RodA [Candidatus Gottesmanbacteria bacterium GW2011_GWA2_43_14]